MPRLADVHVLAVVFNREIAAAAKRLKLAQVPGAGLDRIDRSALSAATSLANAYRHEVGIAKYVMGVMLAMTRRFCPIDAALRRGSWVSQWGVGTATPPPWPELAGKMLGILGYGRIGHALAHRARAFDMAVYAIRRDVAGSSAGLTFLGGRDALHDVLRRTDYLAVTRSLNDQTRGLIQACELSLMKPTAALVGNPHRRRRPRRLVSLSDGAGTDLPVATALPRTRQRAEDPAHLRLDRGHAGGTRDADRREHPPNRTRKAAAQPDSLTGRIAARVTSGRRERAQFGVVRRQTLQLGTASAASSGDSSARMA